MGKAASREPQEASKEDVPTKAVPVRKTFRESFRKATKEAVSAQAAHEEPFQEASRGAAPVKAAPKEPFQ